MVVTAVPANVFAADEKKPVEPIVTITDYEHPTLLLEDGEDCKLSVDADVMINGDTVAGLGSRYSVI